MKYFKNRSLFYILLVILTVFSFSILGFKNISLAQTNSIRISLSSASSINPGSSVDLNVSIDTNNSTQEPAGVQFDFIYNPNDIASIVWKSNGPAITSAGKSANCIPISNNAFRCMISGSFNENTISNGILGTVTVTLTNSPAVSVPINFSNLIASNVSGAYLPITATGGTISIRQGTGSQNLSVTCKSSKTSAYIGSTVRWSASVVGGSGTRTYEWGGTENLSGNTSSVSKSYTSEGTKNASVKVTSGTEQVVVECPTITVTKPPVSGRCNVSVSPLSGGDYNISWRSYLRIPVSTTKTYNWSGTDNLTSSNSSVTKRYSTFGQKTGTVNMESAGQSISLNCSANTSNISAQGEDDRPLGGRCSSSISGMKVTWSASASGGSTGVPKTFVWNGSDGFSTTSPRAQHTYTTEGKKMANVTIQSGNQSISLTCETYLSKTESGTGGGSGGGGCFIATAVFGTEMEPEVATLKNFRDEVLLQNTAGKIFVDTYYTVSPPIANFIRENEYLKTIVRAGLEPIVLGLDKLGYNR